MANSGCGPLHLRRIIVIRLRQNVVAMTSPRIRNYHPSHRVDDGNRRLYLLRAAREKERFRCEFMRWQ